MTADPRNEKERKERLRRLDRIFDSFPMYFVTACTVGRKAILATPRLHSALHQFAELGERHGAYIGAYVIMPDHLHLFVSLAEDRRLSDWVKSLKNSLSKALRTAGVAAPHWQKGFFDHVLRSSESYSQKWEYVRQNPVRAGLTRNWEDWRYSGEVWPLEYRK